MPRLVDTHCHLDFDSFDDDRDEVLDRARQAGLVRCVAVAVDIPSAERSLALSRATDGYLVATVGLHPNEESAGDPAALDRVEELARTGAFVAIGETGLDTYRDDVPLERQVDSLRRHLALALDLDLPVILHCRDAFEPLAAVLAESAGASLRGVLHCYTGTRTELPALLEAGLHIGAGGIATFKNSHELRAALDEVPDERLLLETDAPFLAPAPMRGKRNEPAFVAHTATYLAERRGLTTERLGEITTDNAVALFGLTDVGPAAG